MPSMTQDRLDNAQFTITETLAELEGLFLPRCRLTFVMRDPGNDECSMLITNDPDLAAVRRVIEKLERRPAT